MFRKSPYHPGSVTIFLAVFFVCAAAASAQRFAEVGYVDAAGNVLLDESRFTSSISTASGVAEPVGETVLSISGGVITVLRIAEDPCKSEEMRLYLRDTVKGTFTPVPALMDPGGSLNGPIVAVEDIAGPLYVVEEFQAFLLTKCVDDGCFDSEGGLCHRVRNSPRPCACTWVEGMELKTKLRDCKLGYDFRLSWLLDYTVLGSFIQGS